ncbi:telomerase reverse transcriptase-like [Tigriopus californicus]|uniref:telomerase reverse transcriptase-like n=1 Tax=Tigriopus californicus TaxID=6832 RepID=UPI0027DA8A3A|nr:telomerase reverse transcriptase-like [Tigriopus californicus]|eukprot:TCALIF_04404-PA protein Name:"Similar to TERT Telomerase reverse transcriptase (Bos taurus)" AED:0.01 eAED:0.01 QI:1192/1/1/1/0.66/0.25/4/14/731
MKRKLTSQPSQAPTNPLNAKKACLSRTCHVDRDIRLYHLNSWERLTLLKETQDSMLKALNAKIVNGSLSSIELQCPQIVPLLGQMERNLHNETKRKKFRAWLTVPKSVKYTSKMDVFRLIRHFTRTFVPTALLGRPDLFLKVAKAMVGAPHQARLNLRDILPMKVLDHLHWTDNEEALCRLGLWYMQNIVWRLVRSLFHLSDSSFGKFELMFFRKKSWQSIMASQLAKMVASGMLKPLKSAKQISLVCTMPYAPAPKSGRFLPKKSGFRLICHSKARNDPKLRHYRHLLQYVKSQNCPESVDVRGKALYGRIRNFFSSSSADIYFAKVDIKNAFESILFPKLKYVLSYLANKTAPVLFYHSVRYDFGTGSSRSIRSFISEHRNPKFQDHIPSNAKLKGCDSPVEIRTQAMIKEIYQRTCTHTIRFSVGKTTTTFLKTKGLVQGDSLSGVLCDIYFGYVVKKELNPIFQFSDPRFHQGRMFVRGMDDFLFASNSEADILHFLRRMKAGFPNYGCHVQTFKTQTNSLQWEGVQPCHTTIFCGARIDFRMKEVRPDFSPLQGLNLCQTLKFNLANLDQVEPFVRAKALFLSTLKLEPIYLDRAYNSDQTVAENFFVLMAIFAMRTLAMVRVLFLSQKPSQEFLIGLFKSCKKRISWRIRNLNLAPSLDLDLIVFSAFCHTLKTQGIQDHCVKILGANLKVLVHNQTEAQALAIKAGRARIQGMNLKICSIFSLK